MSSTQRKYLYQRSGILIFLTISLYIFPECLFSQHFDWEAGYQGFFDNREYPNEYARSQTMFGSHAYGYAGFTLDPHHAFYAGMDFLYEFGGEIRVESFHPIVYFQLKRDYIDLRLGAFPRKTLIGLPLFLQTDTILYYRPTLQGIYLNLHKSWGYQKVWLDWTSRQTQTDREIFKIGGTGELRKGIFYYRHDFIMTHKAGAGIRLPGEHIRDNGGLSAGIGLRLSHKLVDSLSISTGYCFSYDRTRGEYDFQFYHGSLTQLYLEWYNFGIRTTHYFGDGQLQLDGDGLYGAKRYQRVDLFWYIFRNPYIRGTIEFSFHFLDHSIDESQSFTIYAAIGKMKPGPERKAR